MNRTNEMVSAGNSDFLSGGGEMAALIRATDWSATPLGPIETWPQSLRTTVSLCLASNFPINIVWGPEHNQIYNDGYRVVCGEAHPNALGEAYTKTWASAWTAIGEPFDRAQAGETSFLENQRMFLFRNGYLEETFFTFSLSPIRDESGGIGGLFHPVTETTASMLAERRARLLRDLNARLGEARTTSDVYAGAIGTFACSEFDLPLILLYEPVSGSDVYALVGHIGLDADTAGAPLQLPMEAAWPWPTEGLSKRREPIEINDVAARLAGARCGPYVEPPNVAFVFPISIPGSEAPPAMLIVGASPRLPLNGAYRDFIGLLASAVSAGATNAKSYEEAHHRAEMLIALDEAKTTFFSNVSHEFRTPLTLMLGPIEDALDNAGELAPAQRERLNIAHRNALRLLKLVNSLLDFSRIEAGRMQARFQPTDLSALTSELASNFRSACERAGLSLVVDCAPLSEPIHVDRSMWEKIVLNLISNAFKFTLAGQITVSLRTVGRNVELTVSDTGLGIAEVELPRVFERFHRIEGQKGRTYEGAGIGLALVEELVKLHGGAVAVHSRLGEGSAFSATIPLGTAHLPLERLAASETLELTAVQASAYVAEAVRWLPENARPDDEFEAAVAPIKGRPRIVLADDNADMRGYVKRLLEEGGYEVEAVENGRAALEIAARSPHPDLVLSDVMMPVMDGFALLAALRVDSKLEGLPIILLSARAGEEARVEGLSAGADDYLVKPFSARELRARVDGAVRLARQRRDAARRERDLSAQIATERGRAMLRQTEQRLEIAMDAGRMGSWDLDIASGQIVTSEYCRAIFGLGPDDPHDQYDDILARVHPDDRQKRQDAIDGAIAGGSDLEVEHRIVRADGTNGWVLTRGRASCEEGRPIHVVGVAFDITERKGAEELREQLIEQLTESNEERAHFAHVAAHDLREPLRLVGVFCGLLSERYGERLDEPGRKYLSLSVTATTQMSALLDDLVDFSRLGMEAERESWFASGEILDEVLPNFDNSFRELSADVSQSFLPKIYGNRIRFQRLMQNLVGNALKYVAPGVHPRIQVCAERQGEFWRFSVSDNGIGIASRHYEQIFEPFKRLHDRSSYQGAGLGLAICRKIVEGFGGTMSVRSTEGDGSTFSFTVRIRGDEGSDGQLGVRHVV